MRTADLVCSSLPQPAERNDTQPLPPACNRGWLSQYGLAAGLRSRLSQVEWILRHGISDQVDDIVLGNHAVKGRLLRDDGQLLRGRLRAEVKNRLVVRAW